MYLYKVDKKMSGDFNDYLFVFIVLAVNTIKNHNDGYVLSQRVLSFETGNPPFSL